MRSNYEIIFWLLKNSRKSINDHADELGETGGGIWNWLKRTAISMYKTVKNGVMSMIQNPRETLSNIWNWVKRNKWKILVFSGILIIGIPLAVGFAPAGIVAGSLAAAWQSSIGAVAAGSAFAVLQSLAMTGGFTGIGAALIQAGGFSGLTKLLASLKTPGALLPPEPVHCLASAGHDQSPPRPTQLSALAAEPTLSSPLETKGAPLWKWLAGGSGPPFELEGGVTPEEARNMVLALLACDEELPSLLRDADITQEERVRVRRAVAALPTENLGADITQEERDKIQEALAALPTENLGADITQEERDKIQEALAALPTENLGYDILT